MFCPSCGNEITVELKYCNRCGANLTLIAGNVPMFAGPPVKLTLPSIVVGLTIVIALGIVFSSVARLAEMHVHPAALTWMVLFSMLTLLGSIALLLKFWSKTLNLPRQSAMPPQNVKAPPAAFTPQQLPPRYDPASSVTEHTTRTFTPIYRDPSEPS